MFRDTGFFLNTEPAAVSCSASLFIHYLRPLLLDTGINERFPILVVDIGTKISEKVPEEPQNEILQKVLRLQNGKTETTRNSINLSSCWNKISYKIFLFFKYIVVLGGQDFAKPSSQYYCSTYHLFPLFVL